MSANIKASVDGTQAIIGVGGVDQMTVSNAGVVTANSFVGEMNSSSVTATGSTTARTLANRFADMPSIFDFGAIGNGVADDLPAFTAANNSGKLIFIPNPPVTYNVSAPIKMDKCACLLDPSSDWFKITDSGNIQYLRGFRQDVPPEGCNIWRFTDRMFVGDVAAKYLGAGGLAGNPGNAWFADTVNYAGFLGRNGKFVVSSTPDYPLGDIPGGISVGVRTQDTKQGAIAIGGAVVNDRPLTTVWGLYSDLQHESTSIDGWSHGLEIAAKNKGANKNSTPYSKEGGVLGIWLAGGGDPVYGGVPANPSNTGISFIKNGHTWNKGIVFHDTSLTGCDGFTGAGSAIAMAKGHQIEWWANGSTAAVSYIRSDVNVDSAFQRILISNGGIIIGTETINHLYVTRTNNAVNGIVIFPNITGQPPILAPTGEANSSIRIQGVGTGEVEAGSNFTPSGDNSFSVGKSGKRFTTIWAVNGTIQTSDERGKTEIKDSELGLDFITSLRPVSYKFKVGENVIVEKDEIGNPIKIEQRSGERNHFGLIAQEVKTAIPEGVDFGGWILTDKNDQNSEQGLRYEQFIAPIIKAIKELSDKVTALENK